MGTKKDVMTLNDLQEAPPRKEPVAISVHRYTLTGNYRRDEAYFKGVEKLAEKFNGEVYFNYPYKDLYTFEIGGEFQTQADADKFDVAFTKSEEPLKAAADDAEVAITSKKDALDMFCEIIGQISFVGYLGAAKHLTEKKRQSIRTVICSELDKALLA